MGKRRDIEFASALLRFDRRVVVVCIPPGLFAIADIFFIRVWGTSVSEVLGVPSRRHPARALGICYVAATAIWAHFVLELQWDLADKLGRWVRGLRD